VERADRAGRVLGDRLLECLKQRGQPDPRALDRICHGGAHLRRTLGLDQGLEAGDPDRAVRGERLDHPRPGRLEPLDRAGGGIVLGREDLFESVPPLADRLAHRGGEQRLFRAEVVADRGQVGAGGRHEVAHRGFPTFGPGGSQSTVSG
jgi:hypothetical protein